MAEKLKIIPLGGLNEIGKNMTAYEYGGEIIVVDCGMAFPGDDMYGIDCVIPDVTYLIKNGGRLRGLVITHGHEDHIGAIPYVLKQVNMPIYCTRFTAGLIKLKLQEHRLLDSTKLVTVEAGQTVKAGKLQVEFIHVNHSIADSVTFAIHTRMGVVVQGGGAGAAGGLHQRGAPRLHHERADGGQDLPAAVQRLQAAHHRHHLRQQRPPHPADH